MPDDLAFTSAAKLAALVARRAVSPVEVVDVVLDRIERTQPTLNAFITVCADDARAAAVAAGLGPIGIGTDGGGSSRIPAACCGVVGFKQTLGLVPHDLTPDGFGNQSHITPMTRTVMDAALMLQAMAGPHRCDPHSLGLAVPDFVAAARPDGDLKGVRIAWRPLLGNTILSREVRDACEQALAVFAELGAIVEPVDDNFTGTEPIWLILTQSFWNARFRRYVAQFGNRMSETLLRQMDNGAGHTAVALQDAMFERTRVFREIQDWFERYDIVATPTL